MADITDITIVNGGYKPTNITGGHHPAGADQTIAFPVKLCGLSVAYFSARHEDFCGFPGLPW